MIRVPAVYSPYPKILIPSETYVYLCLFGHEI